MTILILYVHTLVEGPWIQIFYDVDPVRYEIRCLQIDVMGWWVGGGGHTPGFLSGGRALQAHEYTR